MLPYNENFSLKNGQLEFFTTPVRQRVGIVPFSSGMSETMTNVSGCSWEPEVRCRPWTTCTVTRP
ncbi:hypothetical protein DPMN_081310 [Dreissena polymorpha]|uniref:Uncharacterized protein n=1 Tax=Dreissena polymorpha TaxID=45954 RepID=A0A9D3Y753_DREPO|nr:hypothetical protein DPMN_081310 [Dreissena polymorpha]